MFKISALVLILGLSVHEGVALKCWECSSDIDRSCSDRFNITNYGFGSDYFYRQSASGYNQQQPYNPYNQRPYDSRDATYRTEHSGSTEPFNRDNNRDPWDSNYRGSDSSSSSRYHDQNYNKTYRDFYDRNRNRDPYNRTYDNNNRDFDRRQGYYNNTDYNRNVTNSTNRDDYRNRDYNQNNRDQYQNNRDRDPYQSRDRDYYQGRGDYNNRDPINNRDPTNRDPNRGNFDRDRDYNNRDSRDPYFDRDRQRDPYNNRDYNSRDPYNNNNNNNRDGYNRDPYNRDPYNRDPYNRDPINRDNYPRDYNGQQGRSYDSNYQQPRAQAQLGFSQTGPRLVDCNEDEARRTGMRNVCLKKVQRVGDYQLTYIRRCVAIPLDKEIGTCYDPTARGISLDFCEYCEYDGCNSATGLKFNIFLASLVIFLWAFFS